MNFVLQLRRNFITAYSCSRSQLPLTDGPIPFKT